METTVKFDDVKKLSTEEYFILTDFLTLFIDVITIHQ